MNNIKIKTQELKYYFQETDDILNKVFFLGMESMLKAITSNIQIYKNFENSKKNKLTLIF